MKGALNDVEENGMLVRFASLKWSIPTTTLSKWLGGLTSTSKKGPPTSLTSAEEDLIVEWCKEMATVGRGLKIVNLKAKVAQICQSRPNPFMNKLPGKFWWSSFKD